MRKAPQQRKAPPRRKASVKRKATTGQKSGRPSRYTKQLAAEICAELAQGNSLRTVCRQEKMPGPSTVFRWLSEKADFREQYARAKEESADALFEDLLDIADDGSNDWMEKHGKDGESGGYQLNGEHIQRSKLRVDARKWMMSKMKPKKYGDRIQQDVTVNVDAASKLNKAIARADQVAAKSRGLS